MAKKENENFDFETESEGKGKLDIAGFFSNLTKQQKGIIIAAVVGIVLVVAIVIAVVLIGANGGIDNSGSNNNGGGNNGPVEITKLSVAAEPNKKVYYVGDQADFSGLSLLVTTSTGDQHVVYYSSNPEAFIFSGFDSSVAKEEQSITVEYMSLKTLFTVKIIDIPDVPPVLQSIHLEGSPKTEYKVGGTFFPLNAKIVAVYSDGTTKTISLKKSHISGFGDAVSVPGEHEIKVGYFDDNGGYAETYFTITVTE